MLDYPPQLICCCRIHFKSVMKTTLFLSSLLAACATCVAQADDVVQNGVYEVTKKGTTETIEGNLTANFVRIDINTNSSLIVKGDTVINSNIDCPKGSDGQYDSNYLAAGSKIETNSLAVNFDTSHLFGAGFTIRGTVKTDNFIINATEKCKNENGYLNEVNLVTGGCIESLGASKGTVEIGENVQFNIGGPSIPNFGSISNMNTVINGGALRVTGYSAMDGITLNSGTVTVVDSKNTVDLGEISINGGVFSLEEALISSDITVNSGVLNILGDCQTGDLILNGGTIYFGETAVTLDAEGLASSVTTVTTGAMTLNSGTIYVADNYVIDLRGEDLTLTEKVNIVMSVDSLENVEGITLFEAAGKVEGLDKLSVTLVDSTGAEKEMAASYSSDGSVVTTTTVPEPTTATLSLLALVALAVRRSRK